MNLANTVNFERTIFSAEIIKSDINEVFHTDANEIYYFHYVGNSFLWHQIRFMSSILFMIGSGS
jgi:tRNA U38,U39,U40 pseudouridine synthase TruA